MATRSRIGIVNPDKIIVSVYHHWDGYPSGLGKHLVEKYNSFNDADSIICMGDISTLMGYDEPRTYASRGEDRPAAVARDRYQFFLQCVDCDAEFAYLWDDDSWKCYFVNPHRNRFYRGKIPTK